MLRYVTIAFAPLTLLFTGFFAQLALFNAFGSGGAAGRIAEGVGGACILLSIVALLITVKQFKNGPYRPSNGPEDPRIKPGTTFDAPPALKEAVLRMDDYVLPYTKADRVTLVAYCLVMAIAILAPKSTVGDPSTLTYFLSAQVFLCVMVICLSQMRMVINRPSLEEIEAFTDLANEAQRTGALVTPEPDRRAVTGRGGRLAIQSYYMALLRALAHSRGLTA